MIQAKINSGVFTQFDESIRLNLQSVFKICIDDGNEVYYTITIGDSSVHAPVQTYEDVAYGT